MCQGQLHDFLVALPKCEHHMHIEGSLEPSLLFELAARNHVDLPKDDPAFASQEALLDRYQHFTSLDDFLHYYFIGMTVLIEEADFEALAYAYFTKARSQNVAHAEIFFDPQAHTSRGVKYQTVLNGLKKGQEKAQSDYRITSELIVCMVRNYSVDSCRQTYLEALPDLQAQTVRGLGLSGTEKGYHPNLYAGIYGEAQNNGVKHLTAHAGEEADSSYMAGAVEDLGCKRVDHGIKLTENENLIKQFADQKIMVTLCPISNRELRCVTNIDELPIQTYLEKGVPFSINSDDPAYFGGYIQENYCAVQEAFQFGVSDWAQIVKNAIMYSWCSDRRKAELMAMTDGVISNFSE